MKNRNKILYLFVVALAASLVPYLAVDFFDVPFIHGLLSFDAVLLLVALCSPKLSKKGVAACLLALIAYAVYGGTLASVVLSCFYSLLLLVNMFLPRKKVTIAVCFAVFSLVAIVADASVFFYNGFRLYLSDVWGLASFFWWGVLLFLAAPCLCVALQYFFARKILWGKLRLEFSPAKCATLLLILFAVHFAVSFLQERQPILSFPVKDAVDQMFLKGVESKSVLLQQDAKETFAQWNADEPVHDFNKPTLQILVESWGTRKDVSYAKKLFEPYIGSDDVTFWGVFLREAAYTQSAEFEDLDARGFPDSRWFSALKNFKSHGYQAWYVHGYEGNFYKRKENYGVYGFDSLYFMEELVQKGLATCKLGFTGICDSSIVNFLDSLMTDSVPKYIYWTTLDTHPPYEKSVVGSDCEKSEDGIECIYTKLQLNTAAQIVKLARKHPEYRIVVRGDHRPMGALGSGFVSSFYYRWVPMVVFH